MQRLARACQDAVALCSGCVGWARTVNVVSALACPHASGATQVSEEQMKELAVKTETTNPWYWGVRTLVKVGPAGLLPNGLVTKSTSHVWDIKYVHLKPKCP